MSHSEGQKQTPKWQSHSLKDGFGVFTKQKQGECGAHVTHTTAGTPCKISFKGTLLETGLLGIQFYFTVWQCMHLKWNFSYLCLMGTVLLMNNYCLSNLQEATTTNCTTTSWATAWAFKRRKENQKEQITSGGKWHMTWEEGGKGGTGLVRGGKWGAGRRRRLCWKKTRVKKELGSIQDRGIHGRGDVTGKVWCKKRDEFLISFF